MRSGRQKDADLQDALLKQQLNRDLEAVGLAQVYGSPVGSLRTAAAEASGGLSLPPAPNLSLEAFGPGMPTVDTDLMLARTFMQRQQQQMMMIPSSRGVSADSVPQRQAQMLQSNPLEQELRLQAALLGLNNHNADASTLHQAQLLATEGAMSSQRLQQQYQQQQQQRQEHEQLVSELQRRLRGAGAASSRLLSNLQSFPDNMSSLFLATSQQQGNWNPMGGINTDGEIPNGLLLQLLLLEQQRQQEQGRLPR